MKFILLFLLVLISAFSSNAQKQLWGMTHAGGQYGAGVIFKTDSSGNNETVVHDFVIEIEGQAPEGDLLQASDGKLYGMTFMGGANDSGILFQYDPATSAYRKELDFNGVNGSSPWGSLIQASDGKLYGMTSSGGVNSMGVMFQYDPATSTYAKMHDFDGTNGSNPSGTLLQASDGNLYGRTSEGGINNKGVLFQYNPASATYTKKFDFDEISGAYPGRSLIQAADGKLYGMTLYGGTNNMGVLFQYDLATSVYTKELDFNGVNGSLPVGSLIQASDGKLYGMTVYGGTNNAGVLFQFNLSTISYMKEFDFDEVNGGFPRGSLIQALDGKLYGMTSGEGSQSSMGVMFQFDPTSSSYTKKFDFVRTVSGAGPEGSLIQASDGKLYGMTSVGGTNDKGVLFQYDPATSTYAKKLDFSQAANGKTPYASLTRAADGKLYGMTLEGGTNGVGVLFQYDPVNSVYTKELDFDGANGSVPQGSLLLASNGKLYGMTSRDGAPSIVNMGVIFQFDPATSTYSKIHDFDGINGSNPTGTLLQASDGKFYGMTYWGGANDGGVLFQFDPSTSVYTKKFDFDGQLDGYNTLGNNPWGSLIEAEDGKLYGLIEEGGAHGYGVLFQFDPVTSVYTKKIDFTKTDGGNPSGNLIQAINGKLYGMNGYGGANGIGVLFEYDPATSTYTKKFDFLGAANGSHPFGSLKQASDGKLYGMTQHGGVNNTGVLFQYDPATSAYTKTLDFNGANGKIPLYADLIEVDLSDPACRTDINSDGITSQADLNPLYIKFGNLCICPEDINRDGLVSQVDLNTLLIQFGVVCK